MHAACLHLADLAEKGMKPIRITQLAIPSARTTLFSCFIRVSTHGYIKEPVAKFLEQGIHPEGTAANKMPTIVIRFTHPSIKRYKALKCSRFVCFYSCFTIVKLRTLWINRILDSESLNHTFTRSSWHTAPPAPRVTRIKPCMSPSYPYSLFLPLSLPFSESGREESRGTVLS